MILLYWNNNHKENTRGKLHLEQLGTDLWLESQMNIIGQLSFHESLIAETKLLMGLIWSYMLTNQQIPTGKSFSLPRGLWERDKGSWENLNRFSFTHCLKQNSNDLDLRSLSTINFRCKIGNHSNPHTFESKSSRKHSTQLHWNVKRSWHSKKK